jgi:prephenate dehydrogenase
LVRGTDSDPSTRELARRAGIPSFETLREEFEEHTPDAVVICTPLSAIAPVYRECRRQLRGRKTVFLHAGGLQTSERLGVSPTERPGLIGTHPMAGWHAGGFAGARADLFHKASVVVERRASEEQLALAMRLWSTAGASRIIVEDAELHDSRMPVVSHLPQLAATALAITIAERGFDVGHLGTGGRDATRLSASSFEMWIEVLQRSREDSVSLLARLQWNVGRLREALASEDWSLLEELWTEGARLHDSGNTESPPREEGDGA